MKKFTIVVMLIGLMGSAHFLAAQNVGISTESHTPDASAVLDVYATNKGFLPPRVALTGRTDATSISSPAVGLMVYNTGTAGTSPDNVVPGYYYNAGSTSSPSWNKVVNADVQNGMSFQDDGSPILNGTATQWNDLVISPLAGFSGSTNPPTFADFMGNLKIAQFEDKSSNEQQIFFSIQMPHNWKEGTSIYPHVHWTPLSSVAGAVKWNLEYNWQNYVAAGPVAYTSPVTIEIVSSSVASGDLDKHLITAFSAITTSTPTTNNASGKKISSILMCRLYRNSSHASDTYGGNAGLLSFDLHYEVDSFGSRSEYTK
ncbi:MAG: hypothetical protein PHP04_08385 [Bacteroidales bacterium]|nr:hypothetical protein [Bacteroidales bacterium]